jgi:hypothetical protein
MGKIKPPPIVLTSEANWNGLQTQLKRVLSWEFFWSTATGTRITKKYRHCECPGKQNSVFLRRSYRKSWATFFACNLGTADEREYGGRWNQLLC